MGAKEEAVVELCPEHRQGGGQYRCLACAAQELSRALSRIDYLLGEPNDMGVSDYDVHCNPKAVVARLEAFLEGRRAG